MSVKTKIIIYCLVVAICVGMVVYGVVVQKESISEVMPRFILLCVATVFSIMKTISRSPKKQSFENIDLSKNAQSSQPEQKTNIDDIWKIQDEEAFVVEMNSYIAKKCAYGDKMHLLNENQRVFYITQLLEMEVNNGGFSQFFFNSSGNFGNELVECFEKIGAVNTARICKKAVGVFGEKIPTNWEKRQKFLTPDDEKEEQRIEHIFEECDRVFFDFQDDLTTLNYQFIIKNKESFLK